MLLHVISRCSAIPRLFFVRTGSSPRRKGGLDIKKLQHRTGDT